jgi:hypothetical protein
MYGRAVSWTSDELQRFAAAEELQLSASGRTVTIWVVPVGDEVYVRSVYGRGSKWFRATQDRHEGQISTGGVDKDVGFAEVDDESVLDEVGEAYRTKYRNQPAAFVDPLLTPQARAATLRLEPRS